MRWFQPSAPSPDLGAVLACVWSAAARGRHQLIPDGSVELLWIDGGGTWLCGPDTHSWAFHLPQGTVMSGVRFRPGAAADVLGVDVHEVRDLRVALSDLLGSKAERILAERLSDAGGPAARTTVFEDLVRARMNGRGPGSTAELAALRRLRPEVRRWAAGGRDRCVDAAGAAAIRPRRRLRTGVLRPHRPVAALRPRSRPGHPGAASPSSPPTPATSINPTSPRIAVRSPQ